MEKGSSYLALPKRGYCLDGVFLLKSDDIIVTKEVSDAEELTPSSAGILKTLADFFDALPVVLSIRISGEKLEENVVYSRYNVPVMDYKTFNALLSGERAPLIYYSHGGIYVKIRGSKLKELREKRGLSRGALAMRLGVSKRTILSHEEGESDVSVDVAVKLEEIFGSEVFERASTSALREIFRGKIKSVKREPKDRLLRVVFEELGKHGFSGYTFSRAPYDAGLKLTREEVRMRVAIKEEASPEDMGIASTLSRKTNTPLLVFSHSGKTVEEAGEVTIIRERDPLAVKKTVLKLLEAYRG